MDRNAALFRVDYGGETMTDNDIIKALECCSKPVGEDCKECPLISQDCLKVDIEKLAIDLINRLQAENERLQKANERFEKEFDSYYARVKSQAYDEFAERLCEDRVSNDPVVIAVKTELKMMKGEQ